MAGQPRLPNGRFQSTKASSSTGDYHHHHENDRAGEDEMMEYQQQRAWLDHHYRSMYPSSSNGNNSHSRSNSFSNSTANLQNNSNNHNASVKFVNATPDSLESQIKREEMGPKKKRMRTTPEQLRILNKEFLTNSMPSSTARIQLAKRLGMSARAVQVWFQNRRAKAKLDAKRSGQSSPKMNSSIHSGGHRRAFSHNALYSYPSGTSYNQLGQHLGGNYSEGEEALDDHQGFHSEHDSSGIGGALDEYLGGTTGLFLDPSEMILLSPPIDQQKQKHPTPILPGRPAHSASYQQNHHQLQPPADDPIDHRQRLSPFEPVMLGEDFYANRANSLPMVSEYGPGDDALLPETVMLQDPVIPPPPPLLYYCNAFSTSSNGPAMAGNNASAAFYYQPTPQPMLAPFFNTSNNGNNSMNNRNSTNSNSIQKRSFSLPCIRPAIPCEGYYQHPGPRIAEDEELLLGLGTHILEESEHRSNRSHSISEQF